MLLLVALCVPWVTQSQSLSDYTFATNTDASAWVTLSSSATELTTIYDDDAATSVMNIGFSFQFCGMNYTQWSCNSNGRVALGPVAVDNWWVNPFTASNITNSRNVFPLIAALGMDNTLEGTGVWVKYEVVGTAPNRVLVIEYRTPSEYDEDGALVNYQIQLFEGLNKVRFVYGATAATTYDNFQIGIAASATDVITVVADTLQSGPTSDLWSTWPGVNRYYDFTSPVVTCPRPSNLTLSDITPTGATLSWVPGGTETSWSVSNGTNTYTVTDTFYTFTGLSPMTDYPLTVTAVCSPADVSSPSSILLHTACGLITNLPYFNDFENEPYYLSGTTTYAEAFPNCWTRINDASGTYNYYPYINTSSTYLIHGSKSMYWYHTTSTTYANNEYAVFPGIDLSVYDMSDLTVAFYAKTTATASPYPLFIVGVMTDNTDATTFTPLDTITLTTTPTLYSVSLANYTGTGNYIAIRCPRPTSARYCSLDDVFVTDEWCDGPTNVSASTGENEVTLTWNANGGSSFVVILGEDTVTGVTANTYTFNNLTANTEYSYAVATECTNGISMYSTGTVRTDCAAMTVPYSYGFDDIASATFPLCYKKLGDGSATTSTTQYHSSPYGLRFYNATGNNVVVLPNFDEDINDLQLSIWMRPESFTSSSCGSFSIGYVTSSGDPSSFVAMATYQYNSFSAMEEKVIAYDTVPQGARMALRHNSNSSSYYWFVDDIMVDFIPACPRVENVYVNNLTNTSATVHWTEVGDATSWTVQYTESGNTSATPTTVNATSTSITLDNLNPNTTYDVVITVDCGSEVGGVNSISFTTLCNLLDSLPYTMDFEGYPTTSSTSATFVPCILRLNNGSQYFGYPYVGSSTYNHTPGGNRGLYWYNSITTGTYGDYQIIVLPGVNTDLNPIGSLQLKFWARASSSSYSPEFQVGVMTDPTNPNTFQQMGVVSVGNNTTYTEYVTSLGGYTGNGQYVAIRALRPSSSWYAYVDDITLERLPSCPPVTNLAVDAVTAGAAMISWSYMMGTDDEPTGFNIVLVDSSNTVTTYTTTDLHYTFNGLDPNVNYKVYVNTLCGSANGGTDSVEFATAGLPCLMADPASSFMDTLIDGTTTNSYIPSYSFYNYSLTQQIFTATEIGHGGNITSIYFKPSAYPVQRSLEIYLGHIGSSTATAFEFPSDLTLVYTGTQLSLTAGQWNEFQFTTPFSYNGSDNLLVMVRDMTGSYTSGNTWYGAEGTSGVSRYIYQDSGPYTIGSTTGGTTSSFRSSIILAGAACAVEATCANPAVAVTAIDTAEIEITWIAGYGETSWDVDYRPEGSTQWISALTSTSLTSYTISGLTPGATYEFRVSHTCDTTTYYATTMGTTNCVPTPVPFVVNFDDWTSGTAGNLPSICWTRGTNYTYTYYPYASNSYSYNGSNSLYLYSTSTSYSYLALPLLDAELDSLMVSFWMMKSNTSYTHAAQVGVMTDGNDISTFVPIATVQCSDLYEWEYFDVSLANYHGQGRIAFKSPDGVYSYPYIDEIRVDYIPSCPRVTNVTVDYASNDTLVLSWTPGGSEQLWEVTYDSVVLYTDADTILIDQLSGNTLYNFSIRAICDEEDTSLATPFRTYTACSLIRNFPFTETFEAVSPGSSTTSSPFGLPCWRRLNNGTSYGGYPYVSYSSSYNHTPEGDRGLYWYNNTTTGTYGDYQILVLPEVDTTVAPLNTLMFTFWAKPSSTSYQPVFYVGTMSHPDSLESFYYYDTIIVNYTSTDWVRYTVMLENLPDTIQHSYVALRANRPSSSWYAYVDDITLDIIPDCAPVEDVAVTAGPTSAMVSWTAVSNSYQGAIVEYKESTSSSWTSITVSNVNYAAITGLTATTQYDLRVYASCDDANASPVVTDFTTASFGCAEFDSTSLLNVTIGAGSTTNSYIPSTSLYNYGYSQQFFKGSEIGGSGVITSITLTPSAIVMQRTYEIYMGTSTDSAAASFITPNNMTCVYNGGPVTLTAGQPVTFNLTTPFNFVDSNGNNLVVIFRDLTGTYVSGNAWVGDDAWANASRYIYQDGSQYTPGSVSGGTASSFRNKITFFGGTCLQASTCAAPPTIVTDVTPTTIDIAWTPGNIETAWNVYYRPKTVASFTCAATNVTTTNYQFTGLQGGTKYVVMVVPVCADSMSTSLEVTTECAAISQLPFYENFDNWGTGSNHLPSCWSRNGSYSSYTYISSSYNHGNGAGGSIYMYQGSSASYTSRLILPALDTTLYQANQTQLVFSVYYSSTSYTPAHFEVGVTEDPDDPSTFVPVDTVYHSGASTGTWETLEASLANYTGNGANVTVKTFYTTGYDYPYLDDFYLELIPTCPRPDSLRTNGSTTNSVDLAWHERGNATSWIIEYGPMGFDLGTGTTVVANSNPFTLTGLPSSYIGEYYVRSVCGGGDTGEYSRQGCTFSTSQVPATLPYSYDFENAGEWANWQTSSNVATDWYRGTAVNNGGSYSMYISADQGATYKPYQYNAVVNAAIYRDIDFGSIDSSFTVSFDARVGGSEDASYDGLMVFLIDPSIPAIASNSNITSPWGNVNDLYRIATVRLDTTWHTYTASFDTIHGIKRVAFFWFNQNTGSSHPTRLEPAAVDNISIDYSSCARPVALAAVPGSTTADLSWQGSSSLNYEVVYRPYGSSASNNVHVMANTNHVTIGGLNMLNDYIFWVRKYCGAGDTSLWSDGFIFKTTYCTTPDTVNFGDSTSTTGTSYNYPVNNFYRYTLCEIIIDSAELGDNTMFDAIAFSYNAATPSTAKEDVDIYIMPTTATTFSSTSDIHALDSSAVLVYSGPLNCEQGWNMFGFMQPYIWDGHSNLMLVIDDNSNDYDGSTYYFNTRSCSGTKTITYYSDSYDPDPFTVTSGYSGTKTSYQYRPEMMLLNCAAHCSAPNVLPASNITYQSATVNWSSNATDFEVAVKAATDATWPAEVTVSNAYSFDVANLAPATTYQFRVRAICDADEELISDWAEGTFVTDSLPCFVPEGFYAVETGYTTATFTWNADASQNQWSITVWNSGGSNDFVVESNPYIVTGLAQNTTYYAAIKAICGGGAAESEYSDTIQFTTDQCAKVEDVSVSGITTSSAFVTWTSTGAPKYKVEYGDRNFNQGQGTTVVVEDGSTSVTLNNLRVNHNYSVFVMAVCEEGAEGAWSDRADFATLDETGVDVVDGSTNLSIYPNPTSDATTIALSGVNGEVTIVIVDMNGRTVATESMSCEGDCTKRMEVSGLAQGAYFVRVNGEGVNMVRKLVVK